jgi:hypothetical protein
LENVDVVGEERLVDEVGDRATPGAAASKKYDSRFSMLIF